MDDELFQYRHRLPHWRSPNATYFVTWRLHSRQPVLLPRDRTVVASSIEHFNQQRFELAGYVVMDDHVHVLVAPHGGSRLQDLVSGWKSFSAHQLTAHHGRRAPVWQDEYFDRIVRDDAEFLRKLRYILNNPTKRWPEMTTYPWVAVSGISPSRAAGDGRPTESP